MEGFIKLHRKMVKWEWYDDAITKAVFIHLILMANHEPRRYRGQQLEIGDHLTGRKVLAKSLKLSQRQVRTALDKLRKSGEITIKATNQFSVITVNNYEAYHITKDEQRQTKDQQATNEKPTSDKQATTNKNDKKYTDDSWEIVGAQTIFNLMINWNSKLKEPNYQEWAHNLDLLKRVDGHTEQEIFQVVQWLWKSTDNQAEFWRKNILSTKTLRKQFARLFPLSKPPKKPNYGF